MRSFLYLPHCHWANGVACTISLLVALPHSFYQNVMKELHRFAPKMTIGLATESSYCL